MTKVLVFGTFDRLNAGHISFLERAQRFGAEFIVLVVEDEFVIKYKGKLPVWSLKMRMGALRRLPFKPKVYAEDIRESWKSLKTIQPDVIVLSAEQAGWRHRLDVVLKEYNLPTRVEVLSEKQLETNATEEQIRSRAREIFLQHDSQPGHDMDNWLQAENELMPLAFRKVAELSPPKVKQGKTTKWLLVSLVHAALS